MHVLFVWNNARSSEVDFLEIDEGATVKSLIQRKGLKWKGKGLSVRVNRHAVPADFLLHDGDLITAVASHMRRRVGGRAAHNSYLVSGHGLSAEAEAAASRLEIKEHVPIALELVGKAFSGVKSLQFVPGKDPETDEEWLSLEITVEGDIDSVLEGYDAYTEEWVARVPWPYGNRIRLSYNIQS